MTRKSLNDPVVDKRNSDEAGETNATNKHPLREAMLAGTMHSIAEPPEKFEIHLKFETLEEMQEARKALYHAIRVKREAPKRDAQSSDCDWPVCGCDDHNGPCRYAPTPAKPVSGEVRAADVAGLNFDWHAESVKLYRANKSLRRALQEQHDWHLAQGDKDFGDGITLDMAAEYGDSAMYERTTAALNETLPPGIQGYEKWKGQKPATPAKPVSGEVREAIALEIWHRFANTSVEEWEDETHQAEFLLCADAILALPHFTAQSEALADVSRIVADSIEALERNSTSAPVVECLKAALARAAIAKIDAASPSRVEGE